MKDINTILNLVADIHISANPNYFYNEVIYFPVKRSDSNLSPYISLSEVFIDQIDIKLVEEQSEDNRENSSACFFFKN